MPDLSATPEPMQEEILRANAALTARRQDSSSSVEALADAYGALGHAFLAANHLGRAQICYHNASLLAPLDSRWPYQLGYIASRLQAWERAAQEFNTALQMSPDNLSARVWFAEMALASDHADIAELAFTAALSWEPRLPVALAGVGRSALAQGDYARAVDYLERALAIEPQASALHYPLSAAYRGLGDVARADAHERERGNVQPRIPDYDSFSPVRIR